MLETATPYIRDARSCYANADPYVKRLWNRTLIERIEIKGGQLARIALNQPLAGLSCWPAQIGELWSGGRDTI
jgi:hypothetical protein